MRRAMEKIIDNGKLIVDNGKLIVDNGKLKAF